MLESNGMDQHQPDMMKLIVGILTMARSQGGMEYIEPVETNASYNRLRNSAAAHATVTIKVADTEPDIPVEYRWQVFERYERFDVKSERERGCPGTVQRPTDCPTTRQQHRRRTGWSGRHLSASACRSKPNRQLHKVR